LFAGIPLYVTGHSRQRSLLPSAGSEMSTGKGTVICVQEGNRRSGVALAMRHRLYSVFTVGPVWARGNPPYPFTSPLSHLLLYLLVSFTSPLSLSYSLYLFPCFSIYSHSTIIVPLRFQARCRRRRLNLALVFFWVLILCYTYFLVTDACLFLLYLISFCLVV